MKRKDVRRRERRAIRHARFLAGLTAIAIGLGLAAGGTVLAATARGADTNTNSASYWQQLPGEVCVKPSFSSENATRTPFTLPDLEAGFRYSKVIVKAGNSGTSVIDENTVYTRDREGGTVTPGDTFVHAEKNSISHVIYCYVPELPSQGNALTCDIATNHVGRPLSNGVHINMNLTQAGRPLTLSAYIDLRQQQDPPSESGLVVRVSTPDGPETLPLSIADRDSGSFVFRYSVYLESSFTVDWVQFNSTYFNKERRASDVLVCGDLPTGTLVTPTARMVDLTCDTAGSYTLDRATGIRWFIGDEEVQPGRYEVTTASTVTARAEAIAPQYGLESGAQSEFTFTFTDPASCAVPKEIAPVATEATCLTDGKVGFELPSIAGVTWFVNGERRDPNFYPVTTAQRVTVTFTIDENHVGGPFVLKTGALSSFTFDFSVADLVCELTTEPVTDARVILTDPTCELGQQLDRSQIVVDDPTLARFAEELSDLEGPEYTVVFEIIDPKAVFYGSSDPQVGRTLSDGGKTLTFTGTLAGPDRSTDCVTTIELKDPVSFVDSCLGASFTIYRVEGIIYTVYRNDDEPFVVTWADGEQTRTYSAAQGDRVRIVPSAASDRYTIAPDPAPFERTFATYDGDCLPTLPLTEGSAQFTPASCVDTTNWVTLANEPGVQWWVNGEKAAAGTWPVAAGAVVIEATPLTGYGFPLEAQTRWAFDGLAVDDECLPTLALTGVTSTSWWLGGTALLMVLVGIGLLAIRRQQA